MQEIILDLTSFEEKISLHRYLKEVLDFPFYYGANLDALHDELTSKMTPAHILVKYPAEPKGKMVSYLPRLLSVFEDAKLENYHLTIDFEKVPSQTE